MECLHWSTLIPKLILLELGFVVMFRSVCSGPRPIPMHVPIQMQMGTAPNLVPIQWNLTHFHCYFT